MAAPSAEAVLASARACLLYQQDTGRFYRLFPRRAPKLITTRDKDGYVVLDLVVDGHRRQFKAHRLAWLMMTGAWPEEEVDHRNTLRGDNRWLNLRPATHAQNMHNRQKNQGKRFKGIYKSGKSRWRFVIHLGGVPHCRSGFSTSASAAAARRAFAAELHGEFARIE